MKPNMKILVSNNHLQKTGGTENYTFALAVELKRQGYEVEYFTFYKGVISELLEENGIGFMSSRKYDLILANHTTTARYLFPYGYIIQTCHGTMPDLEQPSPYVDAYVSVTEEVKQHLLDCGFESTVIYNGIDCNRFRPYNPISEKLTSVLSLCQSDYMNEFLSECCDELNLNFIQCNKHTDNVWEIEKKINQADLVVGIGRSLYDAMACGRCVISYDRRDYICEALGDGYITEDNILDALKCNCSGRSTRKAFTHEAFIDELRKYDNKDGVWARNFALQNLNIESVAQDYISIFAEKQRNWQDVLSLKVKKMHLILKRQFEDRKKRG